MIGVKGLGVLGSRVKVLVFVILFSASCAEATRPSSNIILLEKAFLEGKYENVANESKKLIEARYSQRDELYYLKGLSELKLEKFKEARSSFETLLSKYPSSKRVFEAHVGIGDSYFLENNTVKCVEIYMEVLEKFPNDKNISIVYYRAGECYRKLGATTKAESYFDKARDVSPLSFESRLVKNIDQVELVPRTNYMPQRVKKSDLNQGITVQAGCFKSKKNAQSLVQELAKKGYESYVVAPEESGDSLYRVKVGFVKSKEEAEGLASKLKKDGYNTKICDDKMRQ